MEEWPKISDGMNEISPQDSEVKSMTANATLMSSAETDPVTSLIQFFSSWSCLKVMVAWILRLKDLLPYKCRKKKQVNDLSNREIKTSDGLTVEDLEKAETEIICYCQRRKFPAEILSLRKGMNIKRSSQIHKLNPILANDVLRVGGRLSRAAMPEEVKHQIILPKDSYVSDLILRHIHEKVGHSGRNRMLSVLRQKYWIPGASASIRKIISKCVVCRHINATPGQQQMADLPLESLLINLLLPVLALTIFGPLELSVEGVL